MSDAKVAQPSPLPWKVEQWAIDYAVDRVVGAVAELPDRTSPDNWPDAMLVTADELRGIVRAEIESLLQPPSVTACNAHEALRAALVKYGQHMVGCLGDMCAHCGREFCEGRHAALIPQRQACTCGLSAALTLAEGQSCP